MRLKPLLLFAAIFVIGATITFGQTFGCPEKDYTCQLGHTLRAVMDDPDNPENMYNVGLVYQRMGDHERAINSFTMYIESKGLKPEYVADGYNNRGISERALKKFDAAVADYSKAIELFPKNARYYVNRANAELNLGKTDEALADYQGSISVDPKNALAYANRGNYFLGIGKTDEALADLTKSIEFDPSYAEAYYTRALLYRNRKQYAKAIPDLDKYIELNPGNDQYLADAYLNRGIDYSNTGNSSQAEKDITRAIELSPRYADAYGARAVLYRQMKKDDLAAADERKFTELTKTPR
jgi:tetratricopeptide (TPR) repeat protein